jgi:uncharacterized membrane protein YeiH
MHALLFLDYAGVAVFAATGALAASRKELDVIGFMFFASLTGVGGGTVRDLILGAPVFWVERPQYILVCCAIAIAVFFAAPLIEARYRLLLWLDAVGLAAFGVFGAYKGLLLTGSAVVAVVTGMMTGTVGGILRDVVAREPSVLLRQEIYVTAALAGALVFILADAAGLPLLAAAAAGFVVAFGVRSGALVFGWTIPAYRSRPGRDAGDL